MNVLIGCAGWSVPSTYAEVFAQAVCRAVADRPSIELMPVGQFPGERRWGYDGVASWELAEPAMDRKAAS